MQHGRIEKTVFTAYKDAEKLIKKSDFFGMKMVDNYGNPIKVILIKLPDSITLISVELGVEHGSRNILEFIDYSEPEDLFVFENLKEATEWLYRESKREKAVIKTADELGDELCKFCPLDENRKGVYSVPGGFSGGCEGSHCSDAYENYVSNSEGE
jgi:hypothetical protein